MEQKRILVVEDLTSIRNFVCEMLQGQGYETIGAPNGLDAFKILLNEQGKIHLVITDFHMPDGSGLELLKKIKEDKLTAHVPVIFLTTDANPENMKEAHALGVCAWIKKPYRAENFYSKIKMALNAN